MGSKSKVLRRPAALGATLFVIAAAACSSSAARSGNTGSRIRSSASYSFSEGYDYAPTFASDDGLSGSPDNCSPFHSAMNALPPSPSTNYDRNWTEGCKAGAVSVAPHLDASAYETGYKTGAAVGVTPGLPCPAPPPSLTGSHRAAWIAGCHVLTYFRDSTNEAPTLAEMQAAKGYQYGRSHKHSITMSWCSFEASGGPVQPYDIVGQWEQGCSSYLKSDNTYP